MDAAPGIRLGDVVAALENQYPPHTAMGWDRVGLVAGDLEQPVGRVHLAVDATLAVVEEARAMGADLVVTHHPLLLQGIHSVATSGAKGATVTALLTNRIALYVAHTNADVATPGVNDALAGALGLADTRPLVTSDGLQLGRVGSLLSAETLLAFAQRVSRALPATAGGIRVAGPPEAEVQLVAVCGGSGDDRFEAVRASRADVYVTADLRHHPALEAREEARGGPPYLVDAGHWATEWLWLAQARDLLLAALGSAGSRLDVHVSTLRTEPWQFTVTGRDG